ncbi:MAG TPA: nuclease-related domain-containing protein [Verrucomicrobiae bacterium]|jgi:hypothetical protein
MARVLGESGRYVNDQVGEIERRLWLVSVISIWIAGVGNGLLLSRLMPAAWASARAGILIELIVLLSVGILFVWSCRKFDSLLKDRRAMRRGAAGEATVGHLLQKLPESYYVINDLSTDFGNLDHVVVGPTGIYAIETKNHRGVVSPDGKGELLINGQPTEKPYIRPFVSRMMKIREKIMVMAPGREVFYEPVFVFTSAFVEAQWGTTGQVKCLRDENLLHFITENKFGTKLEPVEAERIARAFLALARMEKGFDPSSGESTVTQPVKPID